MTLAELERIAARKPAALADLSDTLVFGEGPDRADLMIVGEAPGEDEDLSGRPFVGRAGQLLDKILVSVQLDRSEVYITNLAKRRPPGNRNPTPAEIAASADVLFQQIRLIGPKAIVTLGNVPTQWFLDTKEGITRLHGTWHDWHGIRLMPIYHPAYLLRNPSRERGGPKWQTWEAMQRLTTELARAPERSGAVVIDTAEQRGLF
ncbi:MAG: uracil-DNA glycosylase [Trueperaceae bacterium]